MSSYIIFLIYNSGHLRSFGNFATEFRDAMRGNAETTSQYGVCQNFEGNWPIQRKASHHYSVGQMVMGIDKSQCAIREVMYNAPRG